MKHWYGFCFRYKTQRILKLLPKCTEKQHKNMTTKVVQKHVMYNLYTLTFFYFHCVFIGKKPCEVQHKNLLTFTRFSSLLVFFSPFCVLADHYEDISYPFYIPISIIICTLQIIKNLLLFLSHLPHHY